MKTNKKKMTESCHYLGERAFQEETCLGEISRPEVSKGLQGDGIAEVEKEGHEW